VWRALDARIAAGEPLDIETWRAASIVTVGRLIARAALRREESRGGHFRTDFPKRDDVHWKRRATETREAS
jgi:L-aspartate oxidase